MKKKIVLIVVLSLVMALSVTLAACEHTHTFASDWSHDDDYHWHNATCGDTDEVSEKAAHNMLAVPGGNRLECNVCGYSRSNTVKPQPTEHEHTYATTYSADESGHYYAATCEHTSEKSGLQPHKYTEGICDVCGWWSSASDVLFAQVSKMDIWNYSITFDKLNLSNLAEGMDLTDGELKLSMSADGTISGYGSFKAVEGTVKAVIANGNVYLCAEGKDGAESAYKREELNELLKSAGLDIDAVVAELNKNTAEIRGYIDELKGYVEDIPPIEGSALEELVNALVKIDEEKSTKELTAYVLSADVLRGLNEALATTTVEQYVDGMLGNGFFAELPQTVRALFGLKIGDVFKMLEKQFGLTEDDVIDMINEMIKSNYPDENVNTIEDLLKAAGMDLQGAQVKELLVMLKPLTLEALLQMAQSGNAEKITVNEIVAIVEEMCEAYGDKTLYELMTMGEDAEMTAEDIKAQVEDIADILEENVVIRFYIDGDGKLQKVSLSVNFAEDNGSEELSEIRKTLAGINGELELVRDYELSNDYSDVIKTVEDNLATAA